MQTVRRERGGQALVEVIVGLVALLVLLVSILQLGRLCLLHTETLRTARRDAALAMTLDTFTLSGPSYIRDRTPGSDLRRYSRDDGMTTANPADFSAHVVYYANPSLLQAMAPGNPVSALWNSPFPQLSFGLLHTRASCSTNPLPIVRHLLYNKTTMDVQSDVWMTWTRGIY